MENNVGFFVQSLIFKFFFDSNRQNKLKCSKETIKRIQNTIKWTTVALTLLNWYHCLIFVNSEISQTQVQLHQFHILESFNVTLATSKIYVSHQFAKKARKNFLFGQFIVLSFHFTDLFSRRKTIWPFNCIPIVWFQINLIQFPIVHQNTNWFTNYKNKILLSHRLFFAPPLRENS